MPSFQTEICEVVTLYAQRYEEEIMPFMQSIMQAIWHLVEATGSETRSGNSFSLKRCFSLKNLATSLKVSHFSENNRVFVSRYLSNFT